LCAVAGATEREAAASPLAHTDHEHQPHQLAPTSRSETSFSVLTHPGPPLVVIRRRTTTLGGPGRQLRRSQRPWAGQLIWRRVCHVGVADRPRLLGVSGVCSGGRGAGLVDGVASLICGGGTPGPCALPGVPGSRSERHSRGAAGHS
jgi:hypothetical protein